MDLGEMMETGYKAQFETSDIFNLYQNLVNIRPSDYWLHN